MRRRPDTLLPLEAAILQELAVTAGDDTAIHGFELARRLAEAEGARRLTAHGTLYKALSRLDRSGLVASRWEDPEIALAAGRPRRKTYVLTAAGVGALASMERTTSRAAFRPERVVTT